MSSCPIPTISSGLGSRQVARSSQPQPVPPGLSFTSKVIPVKQCESLTANYNTFIFLLLLSNVIGRYCWLSTQQSFPLYSLLKNHDFVHIVSKNLKVFKWTKRLEKSLQLKIGYWLELTLSKVSDFMLFVLFIVFYSCVEIEINLYKTGVKHVFLVSR